MIAVIKLFGFILSVSSARRKLGTDQQASGPGVDGVATLKCFLSFARPPLLYQYVLKSNGCHARVTY